MKKALVETASGLVVNVIEIEPDDASWSCPDGCELLPASGEVEYVGPGFRWDGQTFSPPESESPSRIVELMDSSPVSHYVEQGEYSIEVLKDAPTLASERAELLTLLHAKLAGSVDLTREEMNKMLTLERES